jgi:catechol 2,3-dioxygenase-like lactoylglutathione lyase family enzyme
MKFESAMPILEVSDVEISAAFYRDKLGFKPGPFFGDPPAFCMVGRGRVSIALDQSRGPDRHPQNQYWATYIYVDDVDAVLADLTARGMSIERGPENTVYNCREIDVADPDGHLICFGQDLERYPEKTGT